MPELRRDVITGAWTVIAPERARRPVRAVAPPLGEGLCPLCPGNETMTPHEIFAIRRRDSSVAERWNTRVVPNPRPALRVEGELGREAVGVHDFMRGIGAHEIIVDTPRHAVRLAELSPLEVEFLLSSAQARLRDLSGDIRLLHGAVFKDERDFARLGHSHTQLIALPFIPAAMEKELSGAKRYFEFRERCVYCDVMKQEIRDRERIVSINERVVVLCPYASPHPFTVWLIPTSHQCRYEFASRECIRDVAHALTSVASKMKRGLDADALTFTIHNAPLRTAPLPEYHWHLEMRPLLEVDDGISASAGFSINPTPPEEAARFLKTLNGAVS